MQEVTELATGERKGVVGSNCRAATPGIVYAMTAAASSHGGIATANLNVLRAINDLADAKRIPLVVLSFLEEPGHRPAFLPRRTRFVSFRGKRGHFAANLLQLAMRGFLICCDHVRLSVPLLPLAAVRSARTVVFAHGSEAWKRLRRSSRWSYERAALCLTNSRFTLSKMLCRMPRIHGVACPLGLSPEVPLNSQIPQLAGESMEFRAADRTIRLLGNRVLLLVGRMHPAEREKGHYELLNVLPSLLRQFSDVQLVCPGPGHDRGSIEKKACERGVGGSVFLPGPLPTAQLLELYRHSYAFVMPSKQEGFGLVYLEAMNYGKPCIGCHDDGAADVILHDETGYLVHNPQDERELFGVLTQLLRDPVRARELGQNGFARLHAYFTAEHYQQRVKEQIAPLL